MAESGPNRVLIGLPERLEKARAQIDLYDKRFAFIRQVINSMHDNDTKLATINGITQGRYDDDFR